MLGNTDNTARPSFGKDTIVKLFYQFLSPISTKKIINNDMIASTMQKTPIMER